MAASCIVCHSSLAQAVKPIISIAPQQYKIPESTGVTTKVLSDNSAVAISGSGAQEMIVIPLEGIGAQPNTEYRVHYTLRADGLQEAANVYLLIREHESEKARPNKPYHV